jgi:hypothetical protein
LKHRTTQNMLKIEYCVSAQPGVIIAKDNVNAVICNLRGAPMAKFEELVLRVAVEIQDGLTRIIAKVDDTTVELNVTAPPDSFWSDLSALQESAVFESTLRGRSTNRRGHADIRIGSQNRKVANEVGSRLFGYLFQSSILNLYASTYKRAKEENLPLFIRLRIPDARLSSLPWETMYDGINGFYLTLNDQTPFARSVNENAEGRLNSAPPIRILGMVAKVRIQGNIMLSEIDEGDLERMAITDALKQLEAEKKARLDWTSTPTARQLMLRCAKGDMEHGGDPWDIFHFIGHGGVDGDSGKGYIILKARGGTEGVRLDSTQLKMVLVHQGGQLPKLVVLNSCSGAQGQPGNMFGSMASELIHHGVPAVIAMQFAITDSMGAAFAEAFYTYLANGFAISRALALARLDLQIEQYGEWMAPVLFLKPLDTKMDV